MLIALLCFSSRCICQTYNGFGYSLSGNEITITTYVGPGGAITIPSSIPGVNGTVTAIGDGAFEACSGLTSVTIPSGITNIGDLAFSGCSGLTSVAIPGGVTNIGGLAFSECSGLTSVAIPSSVSSIGVQAFGWCGGLTTVTLGSGVTSIGGGAFSGCTNLTTVTIPSSATNLGGLVPVGRGWFLWDVPFSACTGLTNFTVDAQNPFYSSPGGVLFNKDETTLVEWPPGRTGAYTVPGSVTNLGSSAFSGSSGLTSVTLGNGVAFLGEGAFLNCTSLTGAYFQGNAPSTSGYVVFESAAPQFSIYYPVTASGWSTPTWYGYPAQPNNYTYPEPPSVVSLMRGLGTLTPLFSQLQPGTNYQLQVSTDLKTWSDSGAVFTATNTSEACPQPFAVTNSNQMFFRLKSAP